MSEQALAALAPPADDERPDLAALAALELPEEDGEPLENQWSHRTQREDLGRKKAIYERELGVLEYVCFGP